jgi:microcystin-dependent protein
MATPFIGEIRLFGFNFAPQGWATCSGQLLPIAQNDALYVLLGTTYGGDGVTTFALPNLNGRLPRHTGAGVALGEVGGAAAVTLTVAQLAGHTHPIMGLSGTRTLASPANASLVPGDIYGAGPTNDTFASTAVGPAGGSQPHSNLQPYLAVNFCIALVGIFPSQN